ncbi:MAG: HAD family phosphatase [Armatimonadetes bacterium]|nr:HAD family phosphatase [Armatimonadota bacterium]
MPEVTALFWDVGGVLLTNGWDRASRREAVRTFGLDREEFGDRHDLASPAFETGRLTLDEYLTRTVFHRSRPFTMEEFTAFMFAQSRPNAEPLALVERLARSGRYLLATLNNESLPLNLYRIEQFGLRQYFSVFFSSCFLGVRKPEEAIYRLALQLTQRAPEECLFIDDRALNLECARQCGMQTIHYRDPAQLRDALRHAGVHIDDA